MFPLKVPITQCCSDDAQSQTIPVNLRYLIDVGLMLNIKSIWFNPLTVKLFNLNFHSLEVVSR